MSSSQLLLFISAACWHFCPFGAAGTGAERTVPCVLFNSRPGGPSLLDCRTSAAAAANSAAAASRHLFVGIRRGDKLLHWELSPPLPSDRSVNRLPAGALGPLEARLRPDVALVLRRLNQPSLTLTALSDLPSLRHLVLADSNFTCLHAGVLDSAPRLISLGLVDNSRLACLQPGALAGLSQLRRLRLTGSPRLIRLDSAAFCGRPSVGLSELQLELPAGSRPPVAALTRLTGLVDLRLSESTAAAGTDDAAALELLPGLADFICGLSGDRLRRLRLNGLAVVNRLLAERLQASIEDFCGGIGDVPVWNSSGGGGSGGGGGCVGGCSDGCPSLTFSSATSATPELLHHVADRMQPQRKRQQQQQQQQQQLHRSPAASDSSRLDRPNLPGTVLLTASAFVAGVIVSLYCLLVVQRRRRQLAKKRRQRSCTLAAPVGGPGAAVDQQDPVRLVGFARRGSCSIDSGIANDSKLLLAVQRL